MSDSYNSPTPRHYIIVVHGIGEQRHNETTVEVVNRFAAARAKEKSTTPYRALLPANLSSLSMRRAGTGHGWSEFKGVPVDPGDTSEIFDGTRATGNSGKNFRFVDMRWTDILQAHQKDFGSTPEHWAAALIERLQPPFTPLNWSARWVMPLLYEIERTLLPMKALFTYYFEEAAQMVFRDVIGDVHLYGDYARTRGQAVHRFHTMMDEIHLRDYIQWCRFERTSAAEEYVPPVYTVIAHSLGSVLSFDALMYAFAKENIRDGSVRHASGCLPFPGYTEREDSDHDSWLGLLSDLMRNPRHHGLPKAAENWASFGNRYPDFARCYGATMPRANAPLTCGELPLLLWRDHVKHFITLGSPIDKFMTLWHHNYRHMGLSYHSFPQDWSEEWLDNIKEPRITHYNLCDEQDPVGHHLDITQECPNYGKVFNANIPVTYRDVVFRRYPVPGVAHVQYWKDQVLFDGLIAEVIDSKNQEVPSASSDFHPSPPSLSGRGRFLKDDFIQVDGVYTTALIWAYFRIPLIATVVTGLLFSYGWIGWWYEGFSLAYGLSLLAGLLLWISPNPTHAYRQEARPGDKVEGATIRVTPCHEEAISVWARWRPRRGLCANLVAGSIAWRRILIWLNEHPNEAFDPMEALRRNIRLSLPTAGGFRTRWIKRIAVSIAIFALAVSFAYLERQYLLHRAITDPPFWYVAALMLTTVSGLYLLVMSYVGIFFLRMKKYGQKNIPDKVRRELQK